MLSQLRNLTEGLMLWAFKSDGSKDYDYNELGPAVDYCRATSRFRILSRLHGQLQASTSHYTLDKDPSERLMLKYYEYLLRVRDLSRTEFQQEILQNLQQFPINIDSAMRDYQEKIAALVDQVQSSPVGDPRTARYYVHSSRPFFVGGRIYYEITFSLAHNRTNKFDRNIGFTDIDMTDKYAASLDLVSGEISVFSQRMPITVIRSWAVSIRPCELTNFSSLLTGSSGNVRTSQPEYRNLMSYLTQTRSSLLDLVDMSEPRFKAVRDWAVKDSKTPTLIFNSIESAREILQADKAGSRLIRYLLLRMRNEVIKAQYEPAPNSWMSGLYVSSQSRPFDTMPLCTSPKRHKPRFADLAEVFRSEGREHELLAHKVTTNVEQNGIIYTPETELEHIGDLDALISRYNLALPPTPKHAPRTLVRDKGHVFMAGYEDGTVDIITQVQAFSTSGVPNHSQDVLNWINANPNAFDDPLKSAALTSLFEHSRVALIYGAAGTGKSTMVNHISQYFTGEKKLFLAHTNPAVDNLKRRVAHEGSTFSTIASHTARGQSGIKYDVLVIDECSTVSNASLLKVLEYTSFDKLVLVGDVYQIESIEFGNWFSTIRSYIPAESVFELTRPFRTSDPALLTFWERVRNLDDKIEESIARNGYAAVLGDTLFQPRRPNEVVLCLNYDGLYGINNVNRFMQASNPNPPVIRDGATFKAGDPVLFYESDRFGGVIFNNLKGRIVSIAIHPGFTTFEMEIDRNVTAVDVFGTQLRYIRDSIVEFDVLDRGNTDEDDDSSETMIPFQIAYAVAIHKAQGLEYDSVKVVITDANEQNISHAIFYTAITRARERLEIFWTPEVQQRMLGRLAVRENSKDEHLLRARRGLLQVTKRPKLANARTAP